MKKPEPPKPDLGTEELPVWDGTSQEDAEEFLRFLYDNFIEIKDLITGKEERQTRCQACQTMGVSGTRIASVPALTIDTAGGRRACAVLDITSPIW